MDQPGYKRPYSGYMTETVNNEVPVVTVLMPVYNAEKYIGVSIDSMLKQTLRNFVLLIIDDGSTDDTAGIIASYTDSRIRNIRNEQNRGVLKSLNLGIELSNTPFIARMDADDIAVPERLEWQVDFMKKNPQIGVSGGLFRMFGNETGIPDLPYEHEHIHASLLFASKICHPTVIMRRELFKDPAMRYGFPFEFDDEFGHKISEMEDFGLWQKLKSKTRFANLDKVLVHYRMEGQNISSKKTELIIERKKKHYLHLLSELNVMPSPQNLALHISLKHILQSQSPEDILSFRKYLEELVVQNNKLDIYPKEALKQVIEKLWQELFYYLPSKGLSYVQAYKQAGKTIHKNQLMYFLKYSVNRIIGRNA